MGEVYQTDKQISDELRELAKSCLSWAKEDFPNETIIEQGLWARSYLIYLEGKLLNHSPKFFRDKELKSGKTGGIAIVKNE